MKDINNYNKDYVHDFIKGIRSEINDIINQSNDDDIKRQLRRTNNSLLELERGLK